MTRAVRFGLLALWVAMLATLALWVQHTLVISTDLRGFMPPPRTPEQRLLLDEIGEGPGSRLLLVAIAGAPSDTLAAITRTIAATLRGDARFLRVLDGEGDLDTIDPYLLPYRYLLSPTLDTQIFDTNFLRDALEQRIEDLGSPASAWIKPLLPRDPTLETLALIDAWAPTQPPQSYDGLWFTRDGRAALLLLETRAPGFDPQAQREALDALDTAFHSAAAGTQATLEISGPGAFTVTINETTSTEANRIGLIDTVAFFLLLFVAYRKIHTVLLGALPLISGGLVGATALALCFGGAHGITLAFGFTLIGVAQDYPIHLFSHLRRDAAPRAIARALWPTLSTGIASTCIAYLAFFASGVDGLKQLAVFTVAGLATAGLTTRFLLPALLIGTPRDAAESRTLARTWNRLAAVPHPRWLPWALAIAAALVLWRAPGEFWQDDLAALTPIPPKLLERDTALRAELGAPDVRYLLVLEGADADIVLTASEKLDTPLATLRERGAITGYELPSRYLPSRATQLARRSKLPDAATLRIALDAALAAAPFRAETFAPFLIDVAVARALEPLDAVTFLNGALGLRLKTMLLPRDGHWTGLITLTGVTNPSALTDLAAHTGLSVRLLDLKHASESLVAAYRTRVLWSLAIAAVLLVVVVAIALRRRVRVLRVLAPMTLSTLLILATLRGGGVALSLFHLVALILAAGLGLDYALFFEHVEDDPAEQRRTFHSILVCSTSTFIVFALLAVSSLPVLRAIGVTVALGVAFNFLLSLLMTRRTAHA